ncbi:MAG: hypothetical protein SRB2_03816 [Desulfobacteraceae bacterium Eth-SRB2]|nr:MAG: hypothetical protein SRB2_03816 [Desulfobacteraceae bacterium Eth-SRB2]
MGRMRPGKSAELSMHPFIIIAIQRPVLPVTASAGISRAFEEGWACRRILAQSFCRAKVQEATVMLEIKEMMGHDSIQTTQRYLHVHTKLVREVLFDDDAF